MAEPKRAIHYSNSTDDVRLGDSVEIKVLFRRQHGRVVYVPGASCRNPQMEYGGLSDVGIRLDDGSFVATVVDPETFRLKRSVVFVGRGRCESPLQAQEEPFGDDGVL